VSGSRAAAAGGRRAHPAVAARRREIARGRGRRRRTGLLIGAGVLSGLALLWWLANGPLLAVSGVSLRGYDREDRAALVAAIDAAASGGTVLAPPVAEVRAAAAAFPWVASVAVQRDWPRGLTVDVEVARPAAAVAARSGEPALVSAAGRVLGPVPEGAGVGWLRLSRPPPAAGYALPEAERGGLAFLAAAAPEVARRVRELGAEATGALSGRIDGGPELRLGRAERMRAKARALALVLAAVPADELAQAAYIDLRIPARPVIGGLAAPAPTEEEGAAAAPPPAGVSTIE